MNHLGAAVALLTLENDYIDDLLRQRSWEMVGTGAHGRNILPSIPWGFLYPFRDRSLWVSEMPSDLSLRPTGTHELHRIHADTGHLGICVICHIHSVGYTEGYSKLLNHYAVCLTYILPYIKIAPEPNNLEKSEEEES